MRDRGGDRPARRGARQGIGEVHAEGHPGGGPDLALLCVTEELDHPVACLATQVEPGDELWAYGHPDGTYRRGDVFRSIYDGPSVAADGTELLRVTEGRAIEGFSGGPVLSWRTGGVCGVLRRADAPPGGPPGARLVGAARVFDAYPHLKPPSTLTPERLPWIRLLNEEQLAAGRWCYPGGQYRVTAAHHLDWIDRRSLPSALAVIARDPHIDGADRASAALRLSRLAPEQSCHILEPLTTNSTISGADRLAAACRLAALQSEKGRTALESLSLDQGLSDVQRLHAALESGRPEPLAALVADAGLDGMHRVRAAFELAALDHARGTDALASLSGSNAVDDVRGS